MCAMGLALLFLAVLATLISCEDPEGNGVLGGRGTYRVPQSCCHLAGRVFPSREKDLYHVPAPRLGTGRGWLAGELGAVNGHCPYHSRGEGGGFWGWGAAGKGGPWPPDSGQPCSALLPAAPGDLDTYWSGTAPICLGGCKGKHKELKRSQCGNGSCCWLGYKSFCRGTARGGRLGQPWGWLQGSAQPAWGWLVLCHVHGVSPAARSSGHKGTQPWSTHRFCPVPWSSPRPHNLVWVHPLGLPFC